MAQSSIPESKEKFVIGVEIGSSSAKIGVAGFDPEDKTNTLTVYNTATLPTVDSVRYGRITNIREVTDTINTLLEKVEKHAPIEDRNILGVYISIGGRTLKSRKISARIVLPDRREITEELVERLCDEATSNLSSNTELLCVEPNRFTVDNIVSPRPIGTLGTRIFGEFTAIICDPANKNDLTEVINERIGLGVCGISVRPIALAQLVLSSQETATGCMLVDFGAETTTVAIFKQNSLHYLATIPIGSRLITKDLAVSLAMTEEDAENLKITLGNAMPDGSVPDGLNDRYIRAVDSIITARLADVVANILAQPGFAGLTKEDLPAGIILTGGGAKLRNFGRLLDVRSRMKVRIATIPADIIIRDTNLLPYDNLDIIALLAIAANAARMTADNDCLSAVHKPAQAVNPESTEKDNGQKPAEVSDPDHRDDMPENEDDTDVAFDIYDHNGSDSGARSINAGLYGYEASDFGDTGDHEIFDDDEIDEQYFDDPDDDINTLVDDDEIDNIKQREIRKRAAQEEERRRKEAHRRRVLQERKKRLLEENRKRKEQEERERQLEKEEEERQAVPRRIDQIINFFTKLVSESKDNSADLD